MGSSEDKVKRAKRRADKRRKQLRDALPRLHNVASSLRKDYKDKNKKKTTYEDEDGD